MKKLSQIPDLCARKKKYKKTLIICACIFLLLPLITIAIILVGFAIWAQGVPLDKSLLPTASNVPTFYDAQGAQLEYIDNAYLPPDMIPQNLANAFIALEDKRFYQHNGYDVRRMVGAMLNNIKSGSLKEGASTITQQLVKNTHLTHERTLSRKLKEIAIATKLEKEYSKEKILAMYLSVIYFGDGAYGVKQAATQYFGKSVDELTIAECATLAGIVKNPSGYSPSKHPQAAQNRRDVVLRVMYEQGYIGDEEYKTAKGTSLICERECTNKKNVQEFYIKEAVKQTCDKLDITVYQLNNSGYQIYTNLDMRLQKLLAQQAADSANFRTDGTDNVALILDNKNGAVLAHYSSLPYAVRRQAGSTLKPIAVYAPSFEEKLISLATPVVDEKVNFGGYSPDNFNDVYYGSTTPREAIKKSMNSVALKIMDFLTPSKSVMYLKKFGIMTSDGDANYALALGATKRGVTPIELAGAYSTLAREGHAVEASYINMIVCNGEKLYQHNSCYTAYNTQQVVSGTTAALISSALCDTAQSGTARSLSALPFEIAAKTGTSQRVDGTNSDAWCVSYTPDHTLVIWHGSDTSLTETGGGHPTKHAFRIWKSVYNNEMYPQFDYSTLLVQREVDIYSTARNKTLTLACEYTPRKYRTIEYFSPEFECDTHSCFLQPAPPQFTIERIGERVKLKLETEQIYSYTVKRIDALGEHIIAIIDGKSVGKYKDSFLEKCILSDSPISLGGAIEYRVECRLSEENSSISPQVCVISKAKIYIHPH